MRSLPQPNAVPYPRVPEMGPEILVFCFLVTTHRLWAFAGWYCKWATVALEQPCSSTQQPRAFEVHLGKGQSTVPCCCVPGRHIQRPLAYYTILQHVCVL